MFSSYAKNFYSFEAEWFYNFTDSKTLGFRNFYFEFYLLESNYLLSTEGTFLI